MGATTEVVGANEGRTNRYKFVGGPKLKNHHYMRLGMLLRHGMRLPLNRHRRMTAPPILPVTTATPLAGPEVTCE